MRRRLLTMAALALGVWLLLGGLADGQVAVCNPDAYGGITWRFMRCAHELHLHHQWRGGSGTVGHTVEFFRHQAALLRAFLGVHR